MGAPDALRTAAVVDPRRGTASSGTPLDLLLQPVRRLRIGLLHHVVRRAGPHAPRGRSSKWRGESITVRSIREKTVRDCETNSDVKSIVARVIYALGQLALIVIKDLHRVLHLRPDLRRLHPAHRTLRPDLRRPGRQRNAIDRRLDDDDHGHGRHGPADGAHPAAAAHLHPLLPDRLAQTQRARHADRLPCSGS